MIYYRYESNFQKQIKVEVEAVLRKRNQLTLPSEAADLLGLHEGDTIIIQVTQQSATLRPVRRSYASALRGIYGDAHQYVKGERADWE